ncbi:MAG TPA: aminotransferase class V-fold PLP-dependent enzyme [Bacteroidia bacterium]|jgi:cysteine desulfurase|nr:aminotransferase class V-fold PLP-dependent enzyme [Bacteroidia bacterium]
MNSLIYLDYNSTTPVDKRVLETMLPYFSEKFGNAASKTHAAGWTANRAVNEAREQISTLINCDPQELVFTSGATEAINLAIKGVFAAYASKGKHIITYATEHKAVLDTCSYLETIGAEITYLPVNQEGLPDLQLLEKTIRPDTILVCAMFANNETGVINPIREIAEIVHAKKSILFCDATQAVGKIILDVQDEGIDLMCMSAHKIYGPKGVGALYARRKSPRVTLIPQMHGGGHERGLRSGTLNVTGIVGLGKACAIAADEMWDDSQRLSMMRTFLEQNLVDLGNVFINGSIKNRLAHVTNIALGGIKADRLITQIPNIAIAMGSACTSALPEPSHVLKAMGRENMADSSVRFSLGKYTTQEEIETTVKLVSEAVKKLRSEA